jgi:hypothetical protein
MRKRGKSKPLSNQHKRISLVPFAPFCGYYSSSVSLWLNW